MTSTLDDLYNALAAVEAGGGSQATSLRLPKALHRAVLIASELGMDESFTLATQQALTDRLESFFRQRSLAEHFSKFPEDVPSLAAVARRRVEGSDHPAKDRPDLIAETAEWVQNQRPDWAIVAADETVDEVLGYVELLIAGVGRGRRSA